MKCPKCNSEIANDSKFCEFCGAKITKKKGGSKWFLWLCLALVLMAAGSVVFWEYNKNKKAEQKERSEKNMVINTIELYNLAYMSNDFSTLSTLYADRVERFHDAYNISNAEVIEKCKKYDATFGVTGKHTSVRWNTLEVEKLPGNFFSIVYIEDYSIDRKDKTKYSKFVLEKHMILNHNYTITSIYDVQLSKSH